MTECVSAPSCAQWLHYTAGDEARLCLDSRKLEPGDVFVALKGAKADGLSFVPVAVARRASCTRASGTTCGAGTRATASAPSLSGAWWWCLVPVRVR